MAPTSAPARAGISQIGRPRKPVTTLEKLASAEAKMAKASPSVPRVPPKPSKPKSLPPPGEAFCEPSPTRVEKKKGKEKRTKPSKPLTTQEKIRASAEAAKKAKEVKRPAAKVEKGGLQVNELGMMRVLEGYGKSAMRFGKKDQRPSVLMRATERTTRMGGRQLPKNSDDDGTFALMDLPESVRSKVWDLAVVYPKFFVWPDSDTGKEQPDLAMAGRMVRKEVLQKYYAENIFAVDISPTTFDSKKASSGKSGKAVRGLAAIQKWSERLEAGGWFGMIRRWAFSYNSVTVTGSMRGQEESGDLVVIVRFVDRSGELDLKIWRATVEVHREAGCVLLGAKECGQCIVVTSPAWLSEAVIKITKDADGGDIRGTMILELAKTIKAKAGELTDVRCKKEVPAGL